MEKILQFPNTTRKKDRHRPFHCKTRGTGLENPNLCKELYMQTCVFIILPIFLKPLAYYSSIIVQKTKLR